MLRAIRRFIKRYKFRFGPYSPTVLKWLQSRGWRQEYFSDIGAYRFQKEDGCWKRFDTAFELEIEEFLLETFKNTPVT